MENQCLEILNKLLLIENTVICQIQIQMYVYAIYRREASVCFEYPSHQSVKSLSFVLENELQHLSFM